jgi:hypothetical protein
MKAMYAISAIVMLATAIIGGLAIGGVLPASVVGWSILGPTIGGLGLICVALCIGCCIGCCAGIALATRAGANRQQSLATV